MVIPALAPPVAPVPVGLLVEDVPVLSRLLTEEAREDRLETTEEMREETLLVGKPELLELEREEEEAERGVKVKIHKSKEGKEETHHRREQLEYPRLAELLQGYRWTGDIEGRLADNRC